MRWLIIGVVALLAGFLLISGFSYLWVVTASPHPTAPSNMIPAGDAFQSWAYHSRHWGNELYGGTLSHTSNDVPWLRFTYHWRIEPPGPGYTVGAARVDRHGKVTAEGPGYVRLVVTHFGKKGSVEFEVLPKVVDYGAQPPQLNLAVGETQTLKFRIRLENGFVPADWSPLLWFPGVNGPKSRYAHSDVASAERAPYVPHVDEWSYQVTGTALGNTTIYLDIAGRELAVPVVVRGIAEPSLATARSYADTILLTPGAKWQNKSFAHGTLYFKPGIYASSHIDDLVAKVESARASVLSLTEIQDDAPLQFFFVESPDELKSLAGSAVTGFSKEGEHTGVFLYNSEFVPFTARELTFIYAGAKWGRAWNGNWIREGLATLAQGTCQGLDLMGVQKGFLEDGKLHNWVALQRDFDSFDPVAARYEAAGILSWMMSQYGLNAHALSERRLVGIRGRGEQKSKTDAGRLSRQIGSRAGSAAFGRGKIREARLQMKRCGVQHDLTQAIERRPARIG